MQDFQRKRLRAIDDLNNGFNCAQSVFRQFSDDYGISESVSTKIASGFGGGLKMAKTCGAVSGAIMSLGLIFGYDSYEDLDCRDRMNEITLQFLDDFKDIFMTTDCKDLLGIDVSIPGNRQKARESGVMKRICPDCVGKAMDLIFDTIKRNSVE